VAVLAPLTEELTFRGLLLRLIDQRAGSRTAIILSAITFGLFHLTGLTTFDSETVIQALVLAVPQLTILGIVLARLTFRSGNLGAAIFTHAGWNLLSFVLLLVAPSLLEGG
jgi:membrane protease YdiL (CAAX protease family)